MPEMMERELFGMGTLEPPVADELADRFDPKPDPYLSDPALWVEDNLGEKLWSKQREIAESVVHNRYTACQSCHGTGKSYVASRLATWWNSVHPVGTSFVVSTAPTQTQVEAILWRELGRAHRKGGLVGRITGGMVPQWKVGAEIIGYGRKPQDLTSKEDAMAAFQGIHARHVLVIIDEACGVPKWLWDAVDTLATNKHARILAIGNPDDPASEFAKRCTAGSGYELIQIGYADTPNFTGEEVDEGVAEDLVSREWVEERKLAWGEKSMLYCSKVLGMFPKTATDNLISPAALLAAQNRELKVNTKDGGVYAYDIARYGSDKSVGFRNVHGRIRKVYEKSKSSTMEVAGAIKLEIERHEGGSPCFIDTIGVGGGVYDRCAEWDLPVVAFEAGGKPYNPTRYGNRRAEVYWEFKEDVEKGLFDLPAKGECDELYAQLGDMKWFIKNGKIWIESKEDMKKRGLPSPDHADACVMAAQRGMTTWEPPDRSREKAAQAATGDYSQDETGMDFDAEGAQW